VGFEKDLRTGPERHLSRTCASPRAAATEPKPDRHSAIHTRACGQPFAAELTGAGPKSRSCGLLGGAGRTLSVETLHCRTCLRAFARISFSRRETLAGKREAEISEQIKPSNHTALYTGSLMRDRTILRSLFRSSGMLSASRSKARTSSHRLSLVRSGRRMRW
jgi:hypothetical protein